MTKTVKTVTNISKLSTLYVNVIYMIFKMKISKLLIRNPENSELCCRSDLISSMNSPICFSMCSSHDNDVITWCLDAFNFRDQLAPRIRKEQNLEFNPMHKYLSWIKSSDTYWSIYFIIWIIYDIPSRIPFRSAYCQIRISGIHISPIVFTFLVFLCEISNAAGSNSDVDDIAMLVT